NAGKTVTFTLNLSEIVTVSGTPTLTLNDGGGVAKIGRASCRGTVTFSETVGAGQRKSSLAATAGNLTGGSIINGAGTAASLSLTGISQSGPQIDATPPAINSIIESPASGDLNAGKTVTLTLNLSEIVTVSGTPTLTLNDGGGVA